MDELKFEDLASLDMIQHDELIEQRAQRLFEEAAGVPWPGVAQCISCKIWKDLDSLNKAPGKDNWFCKDCKRARTTVYLREINTGWTDEEYEKAFIEQDGCCAICGTHHTEMKKGMAADHCHETGRKRKLLCVRCNVGLGYFKDNPEYLKKAVQYLEENR